MNEDNKNKNKKKEYFFPLMEELDKDFNPIKKEETTNSEIDELKVYLAYLDEGDGKYFYGC